MSVCRPVARELQVYSNDIVFGTRFYDICDMNFRDGKAAVVCCQLGCNPVGAERRAGQGYKFPGSSWLPFYRFLLFHSSLFGVIFIRQGYSCTGLDRVFTVQL